MRTSPPDATSRPSLPRVLGTLAAVALLVYLVSRQGWQEIAAALGRVPLPHVLLILSFTALSRLSVAARWHALLRAGEPEIPFSTSLRLTLAGLFAANFLPTSIGGDVVRLAGTLRLAKDPVGSAASIVADRLVGLLGMLLVLPLGLPSLYAWVTAATLAPGSGPAALAVGGVEASRSRRAMWTERIRRLPLRAQQAVGIWIRRPKAILIALAFTGLHMSLLFSNIWIVLHDVGESITFPIVAGLWSLTYLLALIPFSINSLGLRELSLTFFFTNLGGISVESGLALGLILRALDLLASLPGAAFVSGVVVGGAPPQPRP